MRNIQRRAIAGFLIYCALCLASLAYISIFDWWSIQAMNRKGFGFALVALGYGAVFWALVGGFAFYFAKLGPLGRRVFGGMGAALLVLLIAAWPGFYMSDSFSAVYQGSHFPFDSWLGQFTPVLTHAVLQHIPLLGALPLVQVAFAALGLAYAVEVFARRGEWKIPAIILLAWFATSAPALHTTLLVTRDSWFAILSIFIAAESIKFINDQDWRNGKSAGRLLALCAIAYLMRSDGALYGFFFGAVLFLRWRMDRKENRQRKALSQFAVSALAPAILIAVCAKALLVVALPSYTCKTCYEVTLWVNPVAYVLNRGNTESIAPEDLATINRVLPIELIDGTHVDQGIDGFWEALESGELHAPESAEDRAVVRAAVARILMAQPGLFIANRFEEFAETNYPSKYAAQTFPRQATAGSGYSQNEIRRWARHLEYRGLTPSLRAGVERSFVASTQSPLLRHQWAFWPDILLLLTVFAFWKAAPDLAFAAGMLLSRLPVLVLLAPQAAFKYYAAYELATPVVIALALPPAMNWIAQKHREFTGRNFPLIGPLDRVLSAAIMRFGFVSLIGWAGDFLIFVSLTSISVDPVLANIVSAGAAITFVYFASVRRIFSYCGRFIYAKFALYATYQVIAVLIASFAIGFLANAIPIEAWAAKVIVTPLTFLANYLFMKFLTTESQIRAEIQKP